MTRLTYQQIRRIVRFLIDDYGTALSGDDLTDRVSEVLEDIAGFESTSDTTIHATIDQIRSAYHDLSNQTRQSQQTGTENTCSHQVHGAGGEECG